MKKVPFLTTEEPFEKVSMTMALIMAMSLSFWRYSFFDGPHLMSGQGHATLLCLPLKNLQHAPCWGRPLKSQICHKPNSLVASEERSPPA